ncbi:MAG: twin-arginine translocase TatA/TatE family subunit [Bacteroidetes bacterium]|nr:twin-arginine translocase TatA/TatE family subunit [Bacteroidota bacterium]
MCTPLIFGSFGMQEILAIAVLILILFGGKKIPELMKGIGKGVRSFKEGINGIEEEINKEISDGSSSTK